MVYLAPATIIFLEDYSICILTQEAFNLLSQHNLQAPMLILKVLAKRLRSTLELVEELQDGKVSDRIIDRI
jgi:CRP-like cAMP-binding protein